MVEIVVSGTLSEIKNKILIMSAIIKFRKSAGFDLFQPDEQWRYEGIVDDDRICPICFGFDRDEFFSGDRVFDEFPRKERRRGEGIGVIHPQVHQDSKYSWLLGDCRCRVFMLHIAETLASRLSLELSEAIQG